MEHKIERLYFSSVAIQYNEYMSEWWVIRGNKFKRDEILYFKKSSNYNKYCLRSFQSFYIKSPKTVSDPRSGPGKKTIGSDRLWINNPGVSLICDIFELICSSKMLAKTV